MSSVLVPYPRWYLGYPTKRLIDVIGAALLLVLFSPLLPIIALAIKFSSRGPILYRQRRLGFNEKPFTILKFRSMRANSETDGPRSTAANDPRITSIGQFLRKTSLDEIPQLINVLRGDMSLLGPRPFVGFELQDRPAAERKLRAVLRPGMSGAAQVFGRSSLTPEEGIRHDLDYARNCNFWLDLELFTRTLVAFFRTHEVH